MADSIDRQEVQRLAKLARLTVASESAEETSLLHDLRSILAYVDQLKALDTREVAPTSHAVDLPTLLREDNVGPGLPLEKALHNAPEPIGHGFGVPKIIE